MMEKKPNSFPNLIKDKGCFVEAQSSSQSVVHTYFQGDINSVIDEHFTRALSKANKPKDLRTKGRNEDCTSKNGSPMSSGQWNLSSSTWMDLYQAPTPPQIQNSGLNLSVGAHPYTSAVLQNPPIQPQGIWHIPPQRSPNSSSSMRHQSLPELSMVPCPIPERHYTPFLSLLQHERIPTGSSQGSTVHQDSLSTSKAEASGLHDEGKTVHLERGFQHQDKKKDLFWY
nr:PREDICTED: transcription cofactor vestigial-like protein 1 [Latimeria chalumnae]|eukprot:XP_005990402.1 PREDICTED: transcription cofactor vestigial-like protein 1 [Latimeria chalumnae]